MGSSVDHHHLIASCFIVNLEFFEVVIVFKELIDVFLLVLVLENGLSHPALVVALGVFVRRSGRR